MWERPDSRKRLLKRTAPPPLPGTEPLRLSSALGSGIPRHPTPGLFICVCAHTGTPRRAHGEVRGQFARPWWWNPNPQAWCQVPLPNESSPWSWTQPHFYPKPRFSLQRAHFCASGSTPATQLCWSPKLTVFFSGYGLCFPACSGSIDSVSVLILKIPLEKVQAVRSRLQTLPLSLFCGKCSVEKHFVFCFGAKQNWSCWWSWLISKKIKGLTLPMILRQVNSSLVGDNRLTSITVSRVFIFKVWN